MNDKLWYFTRGDGEKYGPYTDDELINMIRHGVLKAGDYVWMMKLEEWVLIGDSIYSFYLPQQ